MSADWTQDESVVIEGYTKGWHFCREWEVACLAGISYVLVRVPGQWKITVHEITGTLVDTTPATVGYATICAMCEVTGYILPGDEAMRLESFALGRPPGIGAIPDFETLRWKDGE